MSWGCCKEKHGNQTSDRQVTAMEATLGDPIQVHFRSSEGDDGGA